MGTPQLIGDFLVRLIKLLVHAFLLVTLLVCKLLSGILHLLESWIEGVLHKKEKH